VEETRTVVYPDCPEKGGGGGERVLTLCMVSGVQNAGYVVAYRFACILGCCLMSWTSCFVAAPWWWCTLLCHCVVATPCCIVDDTHGKKKNGVRVGN